MTMNYQMESSHIVDYQLYSLPGVKFTLRGPQWPLEAETPAVSFMGAAQVFGAFCKYPFPNLVGEMCSTRVLNFGRGGAGPGYYLNQRAVLDYVNQTSVCVIQLMSARSSVENSFMTSVEGLTRVRMLQGEDQGKELLGHVAYGQLAKTLPKEDFFALVAETRRKYIEQFKALIDLVKVPKILLFVGRNAPLPNLQDPTNWSSGDLVGIHPHMISQGVISEILAHDSTVPYVEVSGPAGFNSRMVNRFTGDFVSIKRSETYTISRHNAYISPQLHVRAALKLAPVINNLLAAK